jgi:hypothetical protein
MSNEPFDDDIEVSCFWVSGLETPFTTISSWLALKSEMICSRAFASPPSPQIRERDLGGAVGIAAARAAAGQGDDRGCGQGTGDQGAPAHVLLRVHGSSPLIIDLAKGLE